MKKNKNKSMIFLFIKAHMYVLCVYTYEVEGSGVAEDHVDGALDEAAEVVMAAPVVV